MANTAPRIDWSAICEETLSWANHVFVILALRTSVRLEVRREDFTRRLEQSNELKSLRRRRWVRGDQLKALLEALVLSYRTSHVLETPGPTREVSLYSTLPSSELKRRIRVLGQAQEILRDPGDPIPRMPGTTLQVAAAQASALVWFYQHALDHRTSHPTPDPSGPPESAVSQLAQRVIEIFPERPPSENQTRIRRLAFEFWDYGKGADERELNAKIAQLMKSNADRQRRETRYEE